MHFPKRMFWGDKQNNKETRLYHENTDYHWVNCDLPICKQPNLVRIPIPGFGGKANAISHFIFCPE